LWPCGLGDCRMALPGYVYGRQVEWLAGWAFITIS
jgi:hypothetical protein